MEISEIIIGILILIIAIVISCFIISIRKDECKKIDELIKDNYFDFEKYRERKNENKTRKIIIKSLLCFVIFSSVIITINSLILKSPLYLEDNIVVSINSDSMSYAIEENSYIKENNIKNKFYKYDVVVFSKIENIEDLEIYDIVLYEKIVNNKKVLVAHRIIKINDDNTFELRGDKNNISDELNFEFSSIKGRYLKTLGFSSFINYLTYTIGFYILFFSSSFIIILSIYFDEKEKKIIKTNS